MSIEMYEKNLSALQEIYPDFVFPEDDSYAVTVLESKNKLKTAKVSYNGTEVYLHSKYAPDTEAEREIKKLELKKDSLIIVFGIGLCYHIDEILKRMTSVNTLLVLEGCSGVLKACFENVDCTHIFNDPRVGFIFYSDKSDFKSEAAKYMNMKTHYKVVLYDLPIYRSLFSEMYVNMLIPIKELAISGSGNYSLMKNMSDVWQENELSNLQHILHSYAFNNFRDAYQDLPAVIVSAGPSLDKNIHLLKGMEDKILILATDTGYKALERNGIKAHMFFTVDGQEIVYQKVSGTNFYDTPVVYTPAALPQILNEHKSAKILSLTDRTYIKTILVNLGKTLDYALQGGSVACFAFSMAQYMGANPVIFIGQDLALTDNRSHSINTMYEDKKLDEEYASYGDKTVEDIYGNPIRTSDVFLIFLYWFKDRIANLDSSKIIIDATEGGAKIEGTRIMSFQEALDTYCCENIFPNDIFQKALHSGTMLNDSERKKMISMYRESERGLIKALDIVTKALEACDKLDKIVSYKSVNDKELQKNLDRLKIFDSELAKYDSHLDGLSFSFAKRNEDLDIIEEDFTELDSAELTKKIVTESRKFYTSLKDALDISLPWYKKYLDIAEKSI